MARDIEADVTVNDRTGPGLSSVERRFRETGKNVEKEYDRFGKSAGDGLLRGIGSVSPKLAGKLAEGLGDGARLGAPLLISGISAALPVISGLIGSAVAIGGVGAGVLAGVALAARDARVKEAGTLLGANLLSGLNAKAGTFVQPLLRSIDLVQQKFTETGDTISSIFSGSARFVEPLVGALLDVGQSLAEGIDAAIRNAGPVIDALVTGLKNTGESIKGFMEDVTANGETNAAVLAAAFDTITGVLDGLGPALRVVTDALGLLNDVMPLSLFSQLNSIFNDTDESARKVGSGTFGAAEGIKGAGQAAETSATATKLYEQALKDNAAAADAARAANRSLFDDVTRVAAAEDAASAAVKKNGRTLDENSERGRANRDSLSALATAYNTTRSDMVKLGESSGTVTGTLNSQRGSLIKVIGSMGITGQKARDLADQLLGIKDRKVAVKVNAAGAAATAKNVREEINMIKGKTVTVTVNVNASRLAAVERRLARAEGFAGDGSFGLSGDPRTSRVGGAVEVNSSIAVNLDGRPFRNYAARSISASEKRTAFRNKVGRRDDQ